MSDIAPIGPSAAHHVQQSTAGSSHRQGHPDIETTDRFKTRSRDRVELSDQAKLLERIKQLPEVRQERIEAAREAIASGQYESEERINQAIENLLQDLSDRP